MKEYLARRRDGAPLAVLVAADRTGAELYAHRHLGAWDGRLVEIDSLEEATAKLTAGYLGRGLNPAQASIAAEDTLALLRPRRIIVPEQQAELLAAAGKPTREPGTVALHEITSQGKRLQRTVELREAGVSEALEASWRRLHPEWSDAQIHIAVTGC